MDNIGEMIMEVGGGLDGRGERRKKWDNFY